jgi:hypothetical protein
MAIAPRVILLASRNGKVIFPSWLRPGTLFLGKASTGRNFGPVQGRFLKPDERASFLVMGARDGWICRARAAKADGKKVEDYSRGRPDEGGTSRSQAFWFSLTAGPRPSGHRHLGPP